MKSLPIALDRLLSNPSFERIEGKLLKVADDRSRIIMELKGKKLRTLMAPFGEGELHLLLDKAIVAFVKDGEPTRIFDVRQIPREQKAATKTTTTRRVTVAKPEIGSGPKVKWKKYFDGRMIGEPVKLVNMERGFDMDMALIERIISHLSISIMPVTKSVSYKDFRRMYVFMCEPSFKAFQNGAVLAPPPAPKVEADEDEDE